MKSADDPPLWFMILFVGVWCAVLFGAPAVAVVMLPPQG